MAKVATVIHFQERHVVALPSVFYNGPEEEARGHRSQRRRCWSLAGGRAPLALRGLRLTRATLLSLKDAGDAHSPNAGSAASSPTASYIAVASPTSTASPTSGSSPTDDYFSSAATATPSPAMPAGSVIVIAQLHATSEDVIRRYPAPPQYTPPPKPPLAPVETPPPPPALPSHQEEVAALDAKLALKSDAKVPLAFVRCWRYAWESVAGGCGAGGLPKKGGFNAPKLPTQDTDAFIERIIRYTKVSPQSLVLASVYMSRLVAGAKVELTAWSCHRILLTSVMMASKYQDGYDDMMLTSESWARVGMLPHVVLVRMERDFASLLGWRFYVPEAEYNLCKERLLALR